MTPSAHPVLEIPREELNEFIWGLVAIDPQTEEAWFHRLTVKPDA